MKVIQISRTLMQHIRRVYALLYSRSRVMPACAQTKKRVGMMYALSSVIGFIDFLFAINGLLLIPADGDSFNALESTEEERQFLGALAAVNFVVMAIWLCVLHTCGDRLNSAPYYALYCSVGFIMWLMLARALPVTLISFYDGANLITAPEFSVDFAMESGVIGTVYILLPAALMSSSGIPLVVTLTCSLVFTILPVQSPHTDHTVGLLYVYSFLGSSILACFNQHQSTYAFRVEVCCCSGYKISSLTSHSPRLSADLRISGVKLMQIAWLSRNLSCILLLYRELLNVLVMSHSLFI